MKITNTEVIKNGEQDLIDAITADLDWGAIEEIFLKDHNLGIEEDIEYKKGDIVAFNNQIAYKLEFEVKVNLSILLNREGEYISVSASGDKDKGEAEEKTDVYREALAELGSDDHLEESEEGTSISPANDSDDEIIGLETRAGEMIDNIRRGELSQPEAS